MNRFFFITLLASAGVSMTGSSQTYSTRFEGIESPLSEGGRWTNNGIDWTQITKEDGIASGTGETYVWLQMSSACWSRSNHGRWIGVSAWEWGAGVSCMVSKVPNEAHLAVIAVEGGSSF